MLLARKKPGTFEVPGFRNPDLQTVDILPSRRRRLPRSALSYFDSSTFFADSVGVACESTRVAFLM